MLAPDPPSANVSLMVVCCCLLQVWGGCQTYLPAQHVQLSVGTAYLLMRSCACGMDCLRTGQPWKPGTQHGVSQLPEG